MKEKKFMKPLEVTQSLRISPGMIIADLGCGNGDFSYVAAKQVHPGGKVFSIDVQKGLVKKIADAAELSRFDTLFALRGDIEKSHGVPLEDETCDIVFLINTLFLVSDVEGTLREAFRITKPKGKILIVDWKDSFSGVGPHVDHIIDFGDIFNILEKIGFRFSQDILCGDFHTGFLFTKPNLK